ncbi:MAG TPA: carboxypeptidase regulatory-like domain-containing protein [Pyrinomonadaceae bacterium]|nr:carboxypeptidase regulatory-like domain-containing protein [Pyrinomonadaceae bacterium]
MKRRSYLPHAFIIMALALASTAALVASMSPAVSSVKKAVDGPPAHRSRPADAAEAARAREAFGRFPLHFEANRGQVGREVKYLSRSADSALMLKPSEVVLALRGAEGGAGATLRLRMLGANPAPELDALEQFPGRVNYFRGRDPKQWQTDVPTFARVRYRGVYPGVDAVFYGNQKQLEYDFVVAPGADPDVIKLRFDGARSMRLDERGDLVIETEAGEVRQFKPFTYQEEDGRRREVASSFVVGERGEVGFELAAYDTTRPLVIDPVLAYSSYLGASSGDGIYGVATDAEGYAYVTGNLFGSFPMTAGAYDTTNNGQDVFVAKINPAGGGFVYATYISAVGGNNVGSDIAVDAAGNAYVTGKATAALFPATPGAFDTTANSLDAFLVKLNASGNALLYATYLGGTSSDEGQGVALDAAGNVYVVGTTQSNNFPTKNALQSTFGGGKDAFALKLSPGGNGANDLLYSTFIGGAGDEEGNSAAVDAAGHLYLTGATASSNYPTTANAFDTSLSGTSADAFVTKLDPASSGTASLVYSTLLGGSGTDRGNDLVLDSAATPNVYLVGTTGSFSVGGVFPVTANAYDTTTAGNNGTEAFFARLNPGGNGAADLLYSTFIGGSTFNDEGHSVARDAGGVVYVAGSAGSSNFPVTADALQGVYGGNGDAFLVKINPASNGASDLIYSTYFGGASAGSNATNGSDIGYAVALDPSGNIYVGGETNSPNLTVQNALPGGASHKGFSDGFIMKFFASAAETVKISGRVSNASGGGANFAGVAVALSGTTTAARTTDANGNYSFEGLPAGGTYTVTPARANYTFAPASQTFTNLQADQQNADFPGTVNTYSVGGRVTVSGGPANGQPLAGVSVTLSLFNVANSNLQTVTTNANGEYLFDPQAAERNYAVTPSLPAGSPPHSFSPSSTTTGSLAGPVTKDFTATPLYTIGGRITDGTNPVGGVSVSASPLASVTTNANGEFTLTGARPNTNYTVTPTKTGYTFAPASRALSNLTANATGADFTGTSQTYNITGRITSTTTSPAGQPVSGMTVKLSGGRAATTTTDANGEYAFTGLGVGGNYTVTPELADHTVTPGSQTANNLSSHQTFNFTVTQLFDLRGVVRDSNGTTMSGVTMSLNGSPIMTTQADGKFEFNGRVGGQTYTVRPAKNGYTFSPVQESITLSGDRTDLVFVATPLTFNAGGRVTQPDNATGIGGLVVNLRNGSGGPVIASTTTAADGTYNFPAQLSGANYNVSLPVQAGHSFAPADRGVVNLQADQTALNFVGTPTNYTLSGRVADAGSNPVAGVTVALSGTASSVTSAEATTNASGDFSFSLPAGGNYTVTPAKQDYTFNPASKSYTTLSANKSDANFTGTLAYTIGGVITDLNSAPVSGVAVTLSGAAGGTRTTDGDGRYSFAGLAPGGTYTVTPSKSGLTFDPANRTYGTLSASVAAADFRAVSTEPTDLQITKTASADTVQAGAEVTYTLAVRNNGPNSAANVQITDNLPAGLTFVSCAASAGGTCVGGNAPGNNRTVAFNALAVNSTATVTLVARVNADAANNTQIMNTAQVSATNGDTKGDNNSSASVINVTRPAPQANLSLSVGESADPVAADQNLTYTLAVHNGGTGAASSVVLTATLPGGADFVSASAGCARSGGTLTCELGEMSNGANRQVNVVVKPTAEGKLSFAAGVTSATEDPDGSNNSASASTDVHPLGTAVEPGDIIISEFRTQGGGAEDNHLDDFVELYNTTDRAITVGPADASGGWALVAREAGVDAQPVVRAVVPTGTVIPARGHFLVVSSGYTLGAFAQGDLTVEGNIFDSGGLALFRTADGSKFTSLAERLDAAGFSDVSDQMFREGAGLAPVGRFAAEQTFARVLTSGRPQDTGVNAADFQFLTTTGDLLGGVQSTLGAPGPENLSSPLLSTSSMPTSLIDPLASSTAAPNRVRDTTPGDPQTSALGTLSIRRTFTNMTGAPVTRLRFRIVDVTTRPAPAGVADMRVVSSPDVQVTRTDGSPLVVKGTTLEHAAAQPSGGGYNSTVSAGHITLDAPLAAGESVSVQFLLGVQQSGKFRFFVTVEAK